MSSFGRHSKASQAKQRKAEGVAQTSTRSYTSRLVRNTNRGIKVSEMSDSRRKEKAAPTRRSSRPSTRINTLASGSSSWSLSLRSHHPRSGASSPVSSSNLGSPQTVPRTDSEPSSPQDATTPQTCSRSASVTSSPVDTFSGSQSFSLETLSQAEIASALPSLHPSVFASESGGSSHDQKGFNGSLSATTLSLSVSGPSRRFPCPLCDFTGSDSEAKLFAHIRRAHKGDALPDHFTTEHSLEQCCSCQVYYRDTSLAAHERVCERKAARLSRSTVPSLSSGAPRILAQPPPGMSWLFGRPSTRSYSWIYNALILCALDEIKLAGMVEFAAGWRWPELVAAYREDFFRRGIVRSSIFFDSKDHVSADEQVRLLYGPMAGGQSNVPDRIEGMLRSWAASTARSYEARPSGPGRRQENKEASQSEQSPELIISKLQIWFDGGARGNPGRAGAGCNVFAVPLQGDNQLVRSNTIFVGDSATNNEAEYAGVIKGLEGAVDALQQGGPHPGLLVELFGDSKLVLEQIGRYVQ